jgi:hypothetical protein
MESPIHIDNPLFGWLPSSSLRSSKTKRLAPQDRKLQLPDWIAKKIRDTVEYRFVFRIMGSNSLIN